MSIRPFVHFCLPLSFFHSCLSLSSLYFVVFDDGRVLQQHGVPLFLTVNFDLRAHVENLGHGVAGCLGIRLLARRCCGFLTKRGGRVKTWRRRWFLFDMDHRRLAYYTGEEHHAEHTLKFYSAVTSAVIFRIKYKNDILLFPTSTVAAAA